MLVWKFYLKDIAAGGAWQLLKNRDGSDYEPDGWDGFSFTLHRSDDYEGLDNVYSDSLVFTDIPGEIVSAFYDKYGFDGQIGIKIDSVCDGSVIDTIEAILNMSTFTKENGECTVKMEFSSFDRKFKNRLTTVVDFNKNSAIDGQALDPMPAKTVGLHSKRIIFQEIWQGKSGLQTFDNIGTIQAYVQPEIDNIVDEIDGAGASGNSPQWITALGTNIPDNLQTLWRNNTGAPKTILFKYDLAGSVILNEQDLSGINPGGEWWFSFAIQNNNGGLFYPYVSPGAAFPTTPGATETILYAPNRKILFPGGPDPRPGYTSNARLNFNVQGQFSITVANTNSIFFYCHSTFIEPNGHNANLRLDFIFSKFNISLVDSSIIAPSTTNGHMIYESLNRVVESYTGVKDSLRSNYYGRSNSSPHAYITNGCGSHSLITNGLNIRNMIDANGNKFPFKTNFKDLYDTLNSIDNIGLRIEVDSAGKQYVRIEPKQYFYQEAVFKTLENVSDIKISVALDKCYNSLEIGYNTWQLSSITNNALDEFNTVHQYSLAVTNANASLIKKAPFIASGYALEFTRRKQYRFGSNDVFETDNNNFIIALNRDDVSSNLFTGVTATFPPDSVSERDENFTIDPRYLIDPSTVYNIRFAPIIMAMRWAKTLFATLANKAKVIQFQSGEGNVLERHLQNDTCRVSDQTIQENANINDSMIVDYERKSLYLPYYIEFEQPLTFSEFLDIRTNSNKCLALSCSTGEQYKGFIKELIFVPAADGGIGQFKLLAANA